MEVGRRMEHEREVDEDQVQLWSSDRSPNRKGAFVQKCLEFTKVIFNTGQTGQNRWTF